MRISDVNLLRDRKYDLIGNIGHGAYSKVKLFQSKDLNKPVSIKIINKSLAPRDFVQNFLPREIDVLQVVRHHNIVDIYEILATNDGRIFVISEYAQYGDLLHHIQATGAMSETHARDLFRQLSTAIEYLHENKIVHRDLKCENLLLTYNLAPHEVSSTGSSYDSKMSILSSNSGSDPVDKDVICESLPSNFNLGAVKIILADFGFSRKFTDYEEKSRTFCGSAAYAAPEIIKGEPYLLRNHDMWSLGVILFIMVCGTMPYDDSNIRQMLKDQLGRRVRFPPQVLSKISSECKDLIHRLIEPDVSKRYLVNQILEHNWISIKVRAPSVQRNFSTSKSILSDKQKKLWW